MDNHSGSQNKLVLQQNEISSLRSMQCPYFKKVNFHRIEQRVDTEQQSQKHAINDKVNFTFRSSTLESVEESIPEQGCTNDIKVERYQRVKRYDSFNSVNSGEVDEVDKIITIKMPKSLKIKQLNIERSAFENGGQQSDDKENLNVKRPSCLNRRVLREPELSQIMEQELTLESETVMKHKEAKVFETHRNFFFQTSFDSVIILPATSQNCFCHLDSSILKIILVQKCQEFQGKVIEIKEQASNSYKLPKAKIRYFVDLKKHSLAIGLHNSVTLQLTMMGKGTKQSFLLEFLSQSERITFQCVYSSIMNEKTESKSRTVNQPRTEPEKSQLQNSEERQLKSQWSIDSLRFSVERMSCKSIHGFLDTFDIVLFKGKNIMCKVQRFLTNSDYDHVGLVIKTVDGSLLLLQATGNVGVAIYSFSSIQMAVKKKLYERIAIRKFSALTETGTTLKNRRLIALQEFIREVNGKKYKFDPMYLLSSNVQKGKTKVETQQTFFCSELVAEALKLCGIMKKLKPSYKYLPKHFGDSDGLNQELKQGFFYSDPIILQK